MPHGNTGFWPLPCWPTISATTEECHERSIFLDLSIPCLHLKLGHCFSCFEGLKYKVVAHIFLLYSLKFFHKDDSYLSVQATL